LKNFFVVLKCVNVADRAPGVNTSRTNLKDVKLFAEPASLKCGALKNAERGLRNIHALFQAKMSEKAYGYCVEPKKWLHRRVCRTAFTTPPF
jgi:hypothetical protein